jgi:hypothetical protein
VTFQKYLLFAGFLFLILYFFIETNVLAISLCLGVLSHFILINLTKEITSRSPSNKRLAFFGFLKVFYVFLLWLLIGNFSDKNLLQFALIYFLLIIVLMSSNWKKRT